MSWPALVKGNLLQPSSASTRESENCWPGLWLPWIICCNSGYSQLCFCDAAHSFDQRSPSGAQWTVKNPRDSVEKLSPKESIEGANTVPRGSVRAPKGFSEGKLVTAKPRILCTFAKPNQHKQWAAHSLNMSCLLWQSKLVWLEVIRTPLLPPLVQKPFNLIHSIVSWEPTNWWCHKFCTLASMN